MTYLSDKEIYLKYLSSDLSITDDDIEQWLTAIIHEAKICRFNDGHKIYWIVDDHIVLSLSQGFSNFSLNLFDVVGNKSIVKYKHKIHTLLHNVFVKEFTYTNVTVGYNRKITPMLMSEKNYQLLEEISLDTVRDILNYQSKNFL